MKGLRLICFVSLLSISHIEIDLIYEGIATHLLPSHNILALRRIEIDLIYEGIATQLVLLNGFGNSGLKLT